jgi:hypothetical protein
MRPRPNPGQREGFGALRNGPGKHALRKVHHTDIPVSFFLSNFLLSA